MTDIVTGAEPVALSGGWPLIGHRTTTMKAAAFQKNLPITDETDLVDAGCVKATLAQNFGRINANNVPQAHTILERGLSHGTIVLEGF